MQTLRLRKASQLVVVVAMTLGVTVQTTSLTASAGEPIRVRKNVKALTAEERREYVQAVLTLKATPSPYDPSLSYYDQFVAWHRDLSRCDPADPLMQHMQMGHMGPMFLPWHRQFLLLFENALRQVSGQGLTVPYWDWTDPESTRAVFSDDFMGGDGNPKEKYAVTTGPFRKGMWKLNVQPIGLQWAASATPYITRRFGSFAMSPLPSRDDLSFALKAPLYDVPPYNTQSDPGESFRNAFEGFRPPLTNMGACGPDGVVVETPPGHEWQLHNAVHAWVGGNLFPVGGGARFWGTMTNVTTSPNDPVFFLHHSMIDRIWAQWQAVHGVNTYEPVSGYEHNNVDDVMQPFDGAGIVATPGDVADIAALGYTYDDSLNVPSPSVAPSQSEVARSSAAGIAASTRPFFCRLNRLA